MLEGRTEAVLRVDLPPGAELSQGPVEKLIAWPGGTGTGDCVKQAGGWKGRAVKVSRLAQVTG